MHLVLLLVSWTVVIVAITLLVQKHRERRRRRLEQQILGFSFGGNFHPFKDSDIRQLSVLQCDPTAIFDLTMTGKVGDSAAVVCDLICAGQHCRSVRAVTVAAFRSTCGRLPIFRIGARDLLRYMNDAMHHRRLEHERELEKGLVLQCSDNQGADEFFTRDKLSQLQACVKRFCIESSPDWVFVYWPCTRVERKALPGFIRETSSVAKAVLGPGSQAAINSVSTAALGTQ